MKTTFSRLNVLLTIGALVFAGDVALGQPTQSAPPGRPVASNRAVQAEAQSSSPAIKFDLDFGGGTPKQLVEVIESATKEPLNAIIRDEDKDITLPPLKVRQVTVEDLFGALEQASRHSVAQVTGTYFSDFGGGKGSRSQYSIANISYGFKKQGNLWVFRYEKPVVPPDSISSRTRFYQLEPYMPKYTIEDITTAVQTAWKMMNEPKGTATTTTLKFHKETKLLIAVGEEPELQVIDDVLKALLPDFGRAPVKLPGANRNPNAPATNTAERH